MTENATRLPAEQLVSSERTGATGPASPERAAIPARWPGRVAFAAPAWSLVYGLVALGWTVNGGGFPLGENDPNPEMSMLEGLPEDAGATSFAAAGLAGVVVGLLMARRTAVPRWCRAAMLAFGAVSAIGWMMLVPDARVLAMVGYLPMVIILAPFDAEMRSTFADAVGAVGVNHFVVLGGGFLWAAATVVYARRTAGRCAGCGRSDHIRITTASVRRWNRNMVAIAMIVPAFYALTRWIWVAGFPLGIDKDFHAEGMADGSLWSGAWLGSFALVGSALTLGLVQRWGEVFPRWMLGLRGRRVPIKLAVIPASFVSVIVFSGGLTLIKSALSHGLVSVSWDEWAAVGPAFLWPLWGVALGIATWTYYLRRRGACVECGRDGLAGPMNDGTLAPVPGGRGSR